MRLVEVVGKDAASPPRRLHLLFCRGHAEKLMERDEWFGPGPMRDEGWFVGVEFESFDLGARLAGPTSEAEVMGRAVAYMIGLAP